MKRNTWHLASIMGVVVLLCCATLASAQTAPSLGAAQSFAVLAGSTVTNTGSSVVTGNLGVSPGSAVTGFPPGLVVSGTIHAGNATAASAQASVTTAYNSLTSQACTATLTGQDLGGLTLTEGVYCFASSAQLTGTLRLDAQGNAAAVFIFKIGSTLTTASGSSVVVINGGSVCNVFWQVGSSATLGTSTSFSGNILALASITLNTGSSVVGRTLARTGAVTLASNTVTAPCTSGAPPPACPTITLSPAVLPLATVGVAYERTITGSGGTAPYTFTLVSGTLPAGLTLTPAGVLSGTPTTAGTQTFTIRGTDANGCSATRLYAIIVGAAPPPPPVCPTLSLSPTTLPNGTVAVAYSQSIDGSGGAGPYTFGVTSGALPTGLTLTSAGELSGTPTVEGTFNFTIRGTDANGCFVERSYTIIIAAAPPPPQGCPTITLSQTLIGGTVAAAYSRTITGSGGTGPYSFGVTAGALPPGLTLSSTGELSGTPTNTGSYTFTIRGTDANGCFGERSITIVIAAALPPPPGCPTITISPATLPQSTVGVAHSQALTGSGGSGPYTFGVTGGALPPGLILTSAGVLSGTPTIHGTYSFTIRATDVNGCFGERSYVAEIPIAVPTLPQVFIILLALGLVGIGYFQLRHRAQLR